MSSGIVERQIDRLKAVEDAIETLRSQKAAFRQSLIDVGRATGAFLDDTVSDEFLSFVPGEVQARMTALRAQVAARNRVIAEMAEAIDVADGIIACNVGTDTPKEWNSAFRRVQKARATLAKINQVSGGDAATSPGSP